jgi:hypothetical protein
MNKRLLCMICYIGILVCQFLAVALVEQAPKAAALAVGMLGVLAAVMYWRGLWNNDN